MEVVNYEGSKVYSYDLDGRRGFELGNGRVFPDQFSWHAVRRRRFYGCKTCVCSSWFGGALRSFLPLPLLSMQVRPKMLLQQEKIAGASENSYFRGVRMDRVVPASLF